MALRKQPQQSSWLLIVIVLLGLGMASLVFAGALGVFLGVEDGLSVGTGNVALIHVEGPILSKSDGILSSGYASSTDIVKLIEKADKDKSIKAIALWINSPGGSAVASDEIAQAIKRTNKTSVSIIREMGTSGAYWVASATDRIFAHRASFTGSIGVIASYVDFADFLTEYNLTYQRLVAGKHKDMGSPLKHITDEEREMFQGSLDELHTLFIDVVAENRGIPVEKVRDIATGAFFTGAKAKELGLIDELGGKEEAKVYLEKELDTKVTFVTYKKKTSLFQAIAKTTSEPFYAIGQGIGDAFVEKQSFVRV